MSMTEGARRGFLVVWIVTMIGFSVVAGYLQHNAAVAAHTAHTVCLQRLANVTKANTFYTKMAALERQNAFVDQRLRDERVAAYEGIIYALPVCD